MNNLLKKNSEWVHFINVVLTAVLAFFGATYLYYRKPIGIVLGILLFLMAWIIQKTDEIKKTITKYYSLILFVLGLVMFFSALYEKARILLITFDIALGMDILYFIIKVIRSVRKKEGKVQIIVTITTSIILIACFGTCFQRITVNHVVSSTAEGYDNADETYITGQYMYIEREDNYTIRTIINKPARIATGNMPAIVNVHGGSWIFGWASGEDHKCQQFADELGVIVVNLDYRLLFDKPFPEQQQELVDTVHYLYDHADELNIDKDNIFIWGQSAGGHITAGAGLMLAEENFPLKGEILFYPFTDFGIELKDPEWKQGSDLLLGGLARRIDLHTSILSPATATDEELKNHCPVFLEIGSADALVELDEALATRYEEAGVDITILRLDGATHGFVAVDQNDRKEVAFQKSLEDQCMDEMKKFIRTQISKE